MRKVKLTAVTTAAQRKLDEFGEEWIIQDERSGLDPRYFRASPKQNFLYLIPAKRQAVRSFGAMWVQVRNDPKYEVHGYTPYVPYVGISE